MNFLLKIVEGPNKGAEIALVEGVAVTLGKGDDCDIVLADLTMPDTPLKVEASADGVAVDGESLEPLSVKTFGATSFAVGPADTPWGELKWPKAVNGEQETGNGERGTGNGEESGTPNEPEKPEAPKPSDKPEEPGKAGKKRGGCCGCLVALVVLLFLLAALAWFFRDRMSESNCLVQLKKIGSYWYARWSDDSGRSNPPPPPPKAIGISDIAEKYGLSLAEANGTARLSGNFKTRRERLAATAEAYQTQPGVELDLSDDESFRASADAALFTLTEGALKVASATNRVMSIVGTSSSPLSLKKTLEALNADLQKLRNVDVSGVTFSYKAVAAQNDENVESVYSGPSRKARKPRASKMASPSFPVCGILTTPYPCLVMRDGRRLMEGAAMGDCVIVEIGADSVTLTNSTGRFTWKP